MIEEITLNNSEIIPLQNTDSSISTFFTTALTNSEKMEQDVQVEPCDVLKVFKFKQNKSYRLTEEQYAKWPKIYSISLDQNNKQIVTLEFRNNPNLSFITNILILNSAKYSQQTYSMPVNGKEVSSHIIRIEENSLKVIGGLIGIYNKMSVEAGALLWEAFRYIVEDSMDNSDPRWKEGLSYRLAAWSESAENLDEDYCENSLNQIFDFDYNAKQAYNRLSHEDRQKFFKAIIAQVVKIYALATINSLSSNDKYQTIEDALNTVEKCNKYINHNLPSSLVSLAKKVQSEASQAFETRFEPTFFQNLFSDKVSKHAKWGGAGVGASLSILDKIGIIGKKMPVVQTISTVIDISKIVYSLAYAQKEIYSNNEIKPIDIIDLSKMIVCRDLICNHSILKSLTPESLTKLVKFYSDFVYSEITHNPSIHDEEYLSSYLIKKMTNPESIKELGLEENTKTLLEKDNGETITIAELIIQYNQTICYDQILEVLSGESNSLPNDSDNNLYLEQNNTGYIEQDDSTNIKQAPTENPIFSAEDTGSEICNPYMPWEDPHY